MMERLRLRRWSTFGWWLGRYAADEQRRKYVQAWTVIDMLSPSSSRYRGTGSVTISDKARDYLMKHGNAVHIFTTRSGLSWGRVNLGPSVRRGVPKNAAEYDMAIVNQIRLYLHRDFDTPFPLVVDVHDLLGLRMLYISGWKLV